jgi:hypothetical protein
LRLVDSEALLIHWADNYIYRKNIVRSFYSMMTIPELEARVAEVLSSKGIRHALTGFSGADPIAPVVRYSEMLVYVDKTHEGVADLLDIKKMSSGANVILLTPCDEGGYSGARGVNGIQTASPIQVYLDLRADRGRGEEAAKELMEKVIRPSW